jgi:hypothetical protein
MSALPNGLRQDVRASQQNTRRLSAFGTQLRQFTTPAFGSKHPRCLWQPIPLPMSGEGSAANLSIRTTGASRKGYANSLQLNPEFRRSKCSRCVSVPLGRKSLTPHSAPTAGSQGKTDDTPSVWLWQVEPCGTRNPSALDVGGAAGDVLAAANARKPPLVGRLFPHNGQSKASLNGSQVTSL